MSELKTNKISTNDQNNVAIDNALGLKSYDTTARNALTSAAGDVIYNTTESKPQFYNGTAWSDFSSTFDVDYLVIAGGGGGGNGGPGENASTYGGGGGGAGGYRTTYGSGNISGGNAALETSFVTLPSPNSYTVTVGAGGASSADGNNSIFASITSTFGGAGGNQNQAGSTGGSGGGGGRSGSGGTGTASQGKDGGDGDNSSGGGGGGASADGVTNTTANGVDGGDGLANSITGSSVTRAGGGGSGNGSGNSGDSYRGFGGAGGGGNGATRNSAGTAGTANTGGGGGGGADDNLYYTGYAGGSGLVVLRYPSTKTITVGAGLTAGTETTDGDEKYIVFTAGTGTISFS